MKCPKCGYISFDYNEVCPKCNRNISGEGAKMNHPSYKPDSPALLGSLIGEGEDAALDLELRPPEEIPSPRIHEMGTREISVEKATEGEAEEFEISIEPDIEDEIDLEDITIG